MWACVACRGVGRVVYALLLMFEAVGLSGIDASAVGTLVGFDCFHLFSILISCFNLLPFKSLSASRLKYSRPMLPFTL